MPPSALSGTHSFREGLSLLRGFCTRPWMEDAMQGTPLYKLNHHWSLVVLTRTKRCFHGQDRGPQLLGAKLAEGITYVLPLHCLLGSLVFTLLKLQSG